MATKQDLLDYYSRLETALSSGKPSLDYNDDRAHNTMVMRLMFEKATSVSMFCGELSVLRSGFKTYVEQEIVGGGELVDGMIKSLKDFLMRDNTSLDVIFERYEEKYLGDLNDGVSFMNGLKDKKISLYGLSEDFTLKQDLSHFAFADDEGKIVRIEQDKVKHRAICSFNNNDIYKSAKENFIKLKDIASSITPNV